MPAEAAAEAAAARRCGPGWAGGFGGDERRRDGGRTPSDLSDGGGGGEAVLTASTPFEVDAWAEAIRETKGALVGAAQQKQWRRVRDLAHAGRDANTRDGANQRTALHYVSGYGDTRTATALVTRGANVNARDRAGMTPLGWACLKGNVDVAQSLLKASADPLIKAHSGVLVGKRPSPSLVCTGRRAPSLRSERRPWYTCSCSTAARRASKCGRCSAKAASGRCSRSRRTPIRANNSR